MASLQTAEGAAQQAAHMRSQVGQAETAALAAAAELHPRGHVKCPLHPDQIQHLYCNECAEAVCAVCAHGRHAAHGKDAIADAAAQARGNFEHQLRLIAADAGSVDAPGLGAAAGVATLADADKLRDKIRQMQSELLSSTAQAQSDLDALAAELMAAVQRRHAELTQQLQQQKEAASAVLVDLLSAADRAVAEGMQLRAAVAAVTASDDHDVLADAPRIGQLCASMRDQLRRLGTEVVAAAGTGSRGDCVSALRLEADSKAATLGELSQLGSVAQLRTHISDGPLQRLESCVLAPQSEETLLQFFRGIPVKHRCVPNKLLFRASRDGFEAPDCQKCMGKGPTMTLIKAKESGFVFGAYSHCKWPEDSDSGPVSDPSGRSFLFSLTNATGRPVRLSLRNKGEAIAMDFLGGVLFGGDEFNFSLGGGESAGHVLGNCAQPLDATRAYQPDDGDCSRGDRFFAGSQWFAAADIEVYELDCGAAQTAGGHGGSESEAAAPAALAQLGVAMQPRTTIAHGQGAAAESAVGPAAAPASFAPSSSSPLPPSFAAAARVPVGVRPLQQLESCVLPPASESTLLHFFGDTPVPVRLLFRASRDGFERRDWDARCMGKGPTMTLVKAKESGFVFGAYSHCKWPEDNHRDLVADPSGQSFLFSLTNAANHAVRMSLRSEDEAIALFFDGLYFGWRGVNFVLMAEGNAADTVAGNVAYPLSQLSDYQPDDGVTRPADFLAGSKYFAAVDIEVYEL